MAECPWCKKHIEFYLRDDGVLSKKELEAEKERLDKGFWASIKDVHDEQFLKGSLKWHTEVVSF